MQRLETSDSILSEIDDDLKAYDLENYDNSDGDADGERESSATTNIRSLAYYENNADDPYLKDNDENDAEEREELQILPTDNMIVAAKVEDEVPYLEAYVYEDGADNLYVHHDILLPSIPICLEWIDVPVNSAQDADGSRTEGNVIAVGTMDPDIELWDLDVVDSLYPNAILGQQTGSDPSSSSAELKKKKKRKKSKKANDDYHVDAVLALAANRQHRNLLASASADRTVKLWDLNKTACAKSCTYHTDKVCSIAWHPQEATILLSGGYDQQVFAADMRSPDVAGPCWSVESDVEVVRWNPHESNHFFVTTERGLVYMHDMRAASKDPIWTLQAHDEAASTLDVNPVVPGFIATGSSDKQVKIWDIEAGKPSMVVSRNVGVGKVFSVQFGSDPEVAFRLAVSGSKGALQVWDVSTNAGVRQAFAGRTGKTFPDAAPDRTIGVQQNNEGDETESEADPDGDGEAVAARDWESVDGEDNA